jgi:hypothetical protein
MQANATSPRLFVGFSLRRPVSRTHPKNFGSVIGMLTAVVLGVVLGMLAL